MQILIGIALQVCTNAKRKKDKHNTHPFPSLSITNYRRTGTQNGCGSVLGVLTLYGIVTKMSSEIFIPFHHFIQKMEDFAFFC